MLVKQHKSGQATIVLIVVTMMTVLGVAVASSSQSRINLRDTVYSTQSVQALSCAEAGADRALVDSAVTDDKPLTTQKTLDSNSTTYAVTGCDGYTTTINNYPVTSPGPVSIASLPEGTTQEFNATGLPSGNREIRFKSNSSTTNTAAAVYIYSGSASSPTVTRLMLYCNEYGGTAPEDFINVNSTTSKNIVLDDGTTKTNVCSYNINVPSSPIALRIRPLFADQVFQVPSFQGSTGYKIISTGTSGQIQRDVNISKFFGQLSGDFDESIVAGDSIQDK